ncbi:MAG: DHH family phosphoesterase [Breznakia sp.]
MKFMEGLKVQVGTIVLLELVVIILLAVLGFQNTAIAVLLSLIVNVTLVFWILFVFQKHKEDEALEVARVLGKETKEAFSFGEVGIIIYNEQYEVSWVSSFLVERHFACVGKKVSTVFTDVEELFQGEVDVAESVLDGKVYEIANNTEARVIFVKDITKFSTIHKQFEDESLVVGMVHMDNYADVQTFEDEATITAVNLNLRQPIVDWAQAKGIVIRRLRSDRFFLVLNEEIYETLVAEKFDILTKTKTRAEEIEVNVTLSMSFARGHVELAELDKSANDLVELAQSRGGDQIAVKHSDGDVEFYGGNSEATATRSRVRVRVMAQTFKEVVMESDQIFLSGHKEMDFDCMGANLAISRLVQSYGKEVYIVSKSGGIEKQLEAAMKNFEIDLQQRHQFISDEEALKLRNKNDLFIALDYHNPEHTNAPKLLEKIDRSIVLDHHRRGEGFINKPLLVYLESSASSSCELIGEMIAYQPGHVEISEAEATIMYLGILIDTNHFKMRTGFRTFEACAQLRKWGVNTGEAENFVKEDYGEFESKVNVLKYSEVYHDDIMIACVESENVLSRSLMSMSADRMLSIKDMEASFVIARISETEVGISARSRGEINVQVIMEALQGGGHFSAAATQIENKTIQEVKALLQKTLDEYLEEDEVNESDIA